MAIEIERKFLPVDDSWRADVVHSEPIAQGYLIAARALADGTAKCSVRVRRSGEKAWLNIKSATLGIQRHEYEYPIPLADAEAMLASLCDGVMEKIRHHVTVDGTLFEVDEFLGDNAGLIVIEVELPAVDTPFPRPSWLGREVSDDVQYFNVNLIGHPYNRWSRAERGENEAC
ncbi:MAG TPA: CYTH domain-containing protein [Luteibacter sp.]|jgi:adenylate cyclase|nr:CYTH domain-containing protein [Luteibacter sp.]